MRFADPQACPDCRGALAGQPACPHCGLDLTSVEVRQLWQLLLQADDLLARASHRRVQPSDAPAAQAPPVQAPPVQAPPVQAPPVQAPPVQAPPAQPGPDPFGQGVPSYPTPPTSAVPPRERSWSVGTVLLVLGAFGLVVAGLIFVTRSWEDIGLAGKTLILLAVTVVLGALGVWVTRRPLRASAEAVWSVFLALLTLDVFAARHEDLLGLGALDTSVAWLVWGTIVLALGVAIAVWARPHVTVALVAPAVAGGLGITMAAVGAGTIGDDVDAAWRALVALIVAGLLSLATRPAALPPMTLTARVVTAAFYVGAYVTALVETIANPALDQLVGGGHGVPLVLMAVASVVVGWLVAVVRVPAVALAVLALCTVLVTPISEAGSVEATWVLVAAIAGVLAVLGTFGTNDWMRGVRLGSLPAVAGIVLLLVGLLVDVVETMSTILDSPWPLAWDARLDVASVDNYDGWAVPFVLVGFFAVAWFVPRWPEASGARKHAPLLMAAAVGVGAVDAVVVLRLPVWAAAATLLVLALTALVVHLRGLVTSWGPAALTLVLAAAVLASASHGVSAAAWLAGAVIAAGFAAARGSSAQRQVHAASAAALVLAGTAALVSLLDVDDAVTAAVVLAAALALVAVAGLVLPQHPVRVPVEAVASIGGVVALVVPGSSGELAVRWTLVGAALVGLSFAVRDRRWYVWPGLVSLVVAYVLLIVDSGFSFVEAYTLPLGAAALGIGVYLTRRRPDAGTWALLGPGLAIAMLPSVPQSLADPTDLRALLLGAGAVVVLAVGIRLGWQAPFVAGAVILTLLVLFNIGPYANAAPRVVLIAAVSAVLLGVGITWEDRVRDGRKLVGYVRSMR